MTIEVKIPSIDGSGEQVYRGETEEEVRAELVKAQENATRKIREQQQALEDREARLAEMQLSAQHELEEAAEIGAAEGQKPRPFDKQKYFKLLAEDPVAAQRLALEQVLGVDIDTFSQDYGKVREAALLSYQSSINNTFLRQHPELLEVDPAADEKNSKVLSEYVVNNNWPYTVQSLEAAFALASKDKKLILAQKKEEPAPTAEDENRPPSVITRSSGGGSVSMTQSEDEFIRTAPLDKVRDYIEKKLGQQQQRA